MKQIQILLADDHNILRQSLSLLLSKEDEFDVIGEAEDGIQAVELAEKLNPQVVLMDIAMPHLNGIEATRRIKRKHPDIKILVLTMHSDERYISQVLRAGASGYLLKDASKDELITAIKTVNRGESYLSPSISRKLIDDYIRISDDDLEDSTYSRLTNREREIFQLMTENRSSREIGEILAISPKTVKNHRANIMEKLDLHSQRDVLKYALSLGLIEADNKW